MREDMAKVIVERPRRGGGMERVRRPPRSLDDLPQRLKLAPAGGRTKWLNENLNPLERYLVRQAGRPWNKVYSEIRERIDARHTVQQHILLHVEDFVAVHTRLDGREIEAWRGTRWVPLADVWAQLYVDPRTGLLRVNRARELKRQARRREKARAANAAAAGRRIVGELEQLHCLDGIWYRVQLAVLPEATLRAKLRDGVAREVARYDTRWDVVRAANVSRLHADSGPGGQPGNTELFGRADLYAAAKHQIGTHELRKYGLKR